MKLLQDKIVIITGASRGIGSGIAKTFAENGANVAFTYSSSAESALILENDEEIKRFIEALRMKEIKSKVRDAMDDAKSTLEVVNANEILKNERCIISN